ncbi:MAG: phosphate/phosphite/phosphonate ABC transporter substrate-binding protein [Thermodesulfobacteriota bacterium]
MKKTMVLLTMFFCLLLITTGSQAADSYVFGVHPFKNPAELGKMFKPLRDYLGAELGAEISFRSAKDYEAAKQALINGEIDISYLGPSLFAMVNNEHPGKIRIAAVVLSKGTPSFKGVIVARQDSPITTLADLKGKNFAFGDRESTLSCYMPAYMLMTAGIFDGMTYKFVGSHDNVALGVLNKAFDAGGMQPSVAQTYLDKGLKIVAESEPVPEHVIVVGSKVDDATFEKIRQALINVKNPEVYTAIGKSLTGFAAIDPAEYEKLYEIMKQVDAKIPLK